MIPQSRTQKMSKAKANQKGRRLRRTSKSKFSLNSGGKAVLLLRRAANCFQKKKGKSFFTITLDTIVNKKKRKIEKEKFKKRYMKL